MQRVLITGASNGIGKAIAKLFLEHNATVVNIDKQQPDFSHPNFSTVIFDLANIDEIENLFLSLNKQFDVLINNAGILHRSTILEIKDTDFQNVLNVNFMSAYKLTQVVAKQFIDNKITGKIVNISSINGKVGIPSQFAYSISKAALDHLTRMSAITFAEHNILVNAICPGSIKTDITKGDYSNADEYVIARTPLARWGQPKEVAELAYFLASDLNSYITGECINIDGGRLALNFFKKNHVE